MVAEDDGLRSLSIRMGVVSGDVRTINSTLVNVVHKLERLSLKIDDQSLADGTDRRGWDHPSTNLPPPPPCIHHSNYYHIIHQLISLNHHYYTPL